MRRWERLVKLGRPVANGAATGGAKRRIPEQQKIERAKEYKKALTELCQRKPHLGRTDAIKKVADDMRVSDRTVRDYLKLLPD
jgi:hypothetical protein